MVERRVNEFSSSVIVQADYEVVEWELEVETGRVYKIDVLFIP